MIPLNQDNAGNFITRLPQTIMGLKEGTQEAIETIGAVADMIVNVVDWIKVILNPLVIMAFIDKMTIVIVITLILLKVLGFENLERWILLSILIKIVSMILI
ncbi:MAG: hypothetical protein ACRCX2_35745 [Paraclostridium sp.]